MINYLLYREADGLIVGSGSVQDKMLAKIKVESGTVLLEKSGFDAATHTHVIDGELTSTVDAMAAKQLEMLKINRNMLLNQVDLVYCNAERWSNMTSEEQAAWTRYKQELRDLPETCDINSVLWPVSPAEK